MQKERKIRAPGLGLLPLALPLPGRGKLLGQKSRSSGGKLTDLRWVICTAPQTTHTQNEYFITEMRITLIAEPARWFLKRVRSVPFGPAGTQGLLCDVRSLL